MDENSHLRILLVDDSSDVRVVVSALIRQLWKSAEIDVAAGGREALRKLNGGNYDIVLTDLQMPDLDGYETAAAIRRMSPPRCHVKIICMTGGKISLERIQQCGIDGHLLKPFSLKDLRLKFTEIIPTPL